ncbi:B-cell receptor CD22-like [Thunnus thynnus]|uniref:B-cell receptor CD22-like n=1 Tax=Thunnus thynnus TaxID=8237 RepID=UPI0035282078
MEGNKVHLHLHSINPEDEYSCALSGYESCPSPSVYPPKLPSVSVSPSDDIIEGNSVNLTCSIDANPAANYTWYKKNVNPNLQTLSKDPQLVFSSIQSSESGEYYCTAENQLGKRTSKHIFIDVKYAPKASSVSVSPSGEIVEGSSVTLTCSSDANPAANYTWYKKNVNPDLQPLSKDPQLVFSSIQSSESGEYYCTAENQLRKRTSKHIFIDVKYAPKASSVSVSPSGEIVEGSSVTLNCSSDANPAANYTWYKENQTLLQKPGRSYNLTSITSKDSGSYYCKSENQYGQNSTSLFIDVQYAPKLPSVLVSFSGEIVEGNSVNLTCSSDANPAANYTWYKENEDSPKASGQIFTITDVSPEHSGNYYCEAQNKRGHHNSTLYLTVVAGAWKSIVIGTTTAVLLVIILLFVFLLINKKRPCKQLSEPGERAENREQRRPTERQPEEQDDIHYASVTFSNNQADPVYSNIRPARLQRREEEEEGVEYAAVKFNSAPRTRGQETEEDPAALYSTVNKAR